MPAPRGRYVVGAGGVHVYVEESGAGDNLLLLHGGLETVDMLPVLTAALAERYHVVAPERRGHGRTADIPGPITYAAMADDTLGVMDTLGITRANLVGYSDGANVALCMAMARPERVGRLVLVSGNFHASGMTPGFRRALRRATARTYGPELASAYRVLSPDGPDHWDIVFEKIRRMWLEEPAFTVADLVAVTAPTLVLAGEDDYVTVEHTAVLAGAIPCAQLELVPGGSHGLLAEEPARTTRLIVQFLEAGAGQPAASAR